jgi:hypothetical protein
MKKLLFLVGLLSPAMGLAQVVKLDSVVVVQTDYRSRGHQLSFYRASRADSLVKPAVHLIRGTAAQQDEALRQLQSLLLRQGYTLESSIMPGPMPSAFLIYTKPK